MRILILGGTGFLSHHVAVAAVARRVDVTCAARGVTGSFPDGAHAVIWDRDADTPTELLDAEFDVVLDVSSRPRQVSDALDTLRPAHWIYVSSVSVYSDLSRAHGQPESTPVHEPLYDDVRSPSPAQYGALKSACEELVRVQAPTALVLRPGIIVGPGDPTGRFSYWPMSVRAADTDGDPVLAPMPPEAPMQVIDVRDLADWIVSLALDTREGTLDAVGPVHTRTQFIDAIAGGLEAPVTPGWVPTAHLQTYGVQEWSGPGSVPLWTADPQVLGLLSRDPSPAEATGLTCRELGETARDTLAWVIAEEGHVDGIGRAQQREILAELAS